LISLKIRRIHSKTILSPMADASCLDKAESVAGTRNLRSYKQYTNERSDKTEAGRGLQPRPQRFDIAGDFD